MAFAFTTICDLSHRRIRDASFLILAFLMASPGVALAKNQASEVGSTGRGTMARTGQQPGPGLANSPTILWSAHIGGENNTAESWDPVVSDGTIYVAGGDNLVAIDAGSGAERWRVRLPGVVGTPTVADGKVYIGTREGWGKGSLYAVKADTGRRLWKFAAKDEVTYDLMPAVENGLVFFVSIEDALRDPDTFVFAVNAATGKQQWRFEIDGLGGTSPAVSNGVVFVSGESGLFAIDASSGKQLWKSDDGASSTTPVVVGSTVYANDGEDLTAISASSGKRRWSFNIFRVDERNSHVLYPPAVDGNVIVVPSEDGHIYAVNAKTGKELWRLEQSVFAPPSIVEGVVYVEGYEQFSIEALDAASGSELWTAVLGPYPPLNDTAPAIVDSIMYVSVATGEGAVLYALE